MKLKLYVIFSSIILSSCGAGAPEIYFAGEDIVTVRLYNTGMRPEMTPELRQMAMDYCKDKGGKATYTGVARYRLSGWEEYDFECVDTTLKVQNSGTLDVKHSGSIEIK
jgi:hypothetical protein